MKCKILLPDLLVFLTSLNLITNSKVKCNSEIQQQFEQFLTAVEKGDLPSIRSLIRKVPRNQLTNATIWQQMNELGDTPLHLAARLNQATVIKALTTPLKPLLMSQNTAKRAAIHEAIVNNATQVVEVLALGFTSEMIELREGVYNRTPLYLAAEYGHLGIVKTLKNLGAFLFAKSNDDYGGAMPIHEAARWGHLDVVRYLHSSGCSLGLYEGYYGRTPLHEAAISGSVEMVKFLIERGAVLNEPSAMVDRKFTPLHWAAALGHLSVVKYLVIEEPALLQRGDFDGDLPIHSATLNNRTQVVEYFVGIGVDPTVVQASFGRTPLHQAAAQGLVNLVKWFILLGGNVYSRSSELDCKQLPVHLAAGHGRLEMVRYFVENYESLFKERDGCGRNLFQIAQASYTRKAEAKQVIKWLHAWINKKHYMRHDEH